MDIEAALKKVRVIRNQLEVCILALEELERISTEGTPRLGRQRTWKASSNVPRRKRDGSRGE
jgi:hypothetical protein